MAVHRLNKSRGPSSNINDIHLSSNHKTMPQYLHLHLHHLHLYLHHHNNRDRLRVEEIKAISTREVLKQLHCGNFRNSPLEDKYTCDNFKILVLLTVLALTYYLIKIYMHVFCHTLVSIKYYLDKYSGFSAKASG